MHRTLLIYRTLCDFIHTASDRCGVRLSPTADAPTPLLLGVNRDLVWKWILITRRYWWDVVLVSVHDGHNFHCGFGQRPLHGAMRLDPICLHVSTL